MLGPDKDDDAHSRETELGSAPTTPYPASSAAAAAGGYDPAADSWRQLAARFEILNELGRGGMGIVYQARDRETGAAVAIKVLKPEIASAPELIDRFKTELLLARKITHKNVCRVYDLHRFGPVVAIGMEFVEGESLRGLLGRVEGLSIRHGLKIARQLLAGLAEAHGQGVIHRDLKPENILIASDGTVKVMDFGIARSATAATMTGSIMGTPAYMSPEQAEGKPADARSDIYSLGLILYEMFTGQRAFHADTPVGYAMKQIHETPTPARDLDADLPARIDRAIAKCLEKNPQKRFQSVAEIEAALSGQGEAGPTAFPGEEVQLPIHLAHWQRSDWLLVLAAIAGLVIFFPCFNRTSLAPRSQVHFDRSILLRIAQEHAEQLGAPIGKTAEIKTLPFPDRYDYIAESAGATAALAATNNPVPYWIWQVEWENGTRVSVDNRGSLQSFSRLFPPGTPGRPSPQEARIRAEKAIMGFFGVNPSLWRADSRDTEGGQIAISFTRAESSDGHGLEQRYSVGLAGNEITKLERSYEPPTRYEFGQKESWQVLPLLVFGLVILIMGVAQRRRVVAAVRWRAVIVAFAFLIGALAGWNLFSFFEIPILTMISAFWGIAFALLMFYGSIAFERSVRKVAPAKLVNFVGLFENKLTSEPFGLAILRGTLMGLALLGMDTFLVWLEEALFGARLSVFQHIYAVADLSQSASLLLVLRAIFEFVTLGCLTSFVAAAAARCVHSSRLALFLAAALTATGLSGDLFLNMGSVQPYLAKLAILMLEFLVLTWGFRRFDVLTVCWAAFTFVFCWQNWRRLVMFQPTGALEEWTALALFGLLVIAAAVLAFQSSLRAAHQRLAAAFE